MPKITKHGGVRQDPSVSRASGDGAAQLTSAAVSTDQTITGNQTVTGTITVGGAAAVGGALAVTGAAAIGGAATVNGQFGVTGNCSGIWGPWDNSLVGATSDPGDSSGTLLLTGGTIYLSKIPIPRGGTPTKLYWYVTTGATTATASQCWVAVLNSSGTILGAPVDVATVSETASLKSTTVAPGALTAGTFVWGAIVLAGSTVATVAIQNGSAKSTMTNAGLAAASLRYATNGTGQTTITNRTPASNSAGPAVWMALGE